VTIDCAALTEPQLDAELFGAVESRAAAALCPRAIDGTLFLDEVGELPAQIQAKLVRTLQARELDASAAAVRLVSANHQRLEPLIADGRFREDLYYRLNVAHLVLPTLEERREDIPTLVRHRLAQLRALNGSRVEAFTPAAMEVLMASPWPGNVRQLFNVVDHCHALATGTLIPADLTKSVLAVRDRAPEIESLEDARARFDRDYLVKLMKMTAGNVARAAQLSGRNRTDLYKLLRRHGIEPTSFKTDGLKGDGPSGT
jgi:two-component system response regulator GlrR